MKTHKWNDLKAKVKPGMLSAAQADAARLSEALRMGAAEKPEQATADTDAGRLKELRQLIDIARAQAANGEEIEYAGARELLAEIRARRLAT